MLRVDVGALDLHRGVAHVLTASGLALVVHVGAMILGCGAFALVVDDVLGLGVLLWFNLDRVWAFALVGAGDPAQRRTAMPESSRATRRICGWAAAVAGTSTIASEVVTDMTITFAVTWDYRCPFARNAHEHILTGLAAGADWQVRFLPFSLGQVHVAEGEPSVWDKPDQDTGILALQAGVIVRDEFAGQFPAVHRALFAARHDEGLQLEDRGVVKRILAEHGVTADTVFARIDSGAALASVQIEHEQFARSHDVWGVPTFIAGEQAVFIRFMHRAPLGADPTASIQTIERTLDLVTGWVDLNEFKHTTIPR